uniref:Uncharacterized protein n=1 Tax=viral metagenome TaxID=1070528 RepID=A0A6C0DZA1_9ZZZZ
MISDKLLINLKILSKIQKNSKITRSYDGIISLDYISFYQPVKRFIGNDSRRQAVFEINSIVAEAIETFKHILNCKFINKQYIHSDEYQKCCENIQILLEEFSLAKGGVENLKFTYQNDQNTVSQLDIILLKMSTTIKDVSTKLNILNPIQHQESKLNDIDNTISDLTSIKVETPNFEEPDINMGIV